MRVVPRTGREQGPSDEELMHQLAGGHDEALGVLYDRYATRIRALAAHTLDRGTAEDIVQDVFLAVWRRASTYDSQRGTFRPWVYQIAHYRILNELRRRKHRPTAEFDPDGAGLSELPSPAPGPYEAVWREEQRAGVQSALEGLPGSQREALSLAFFGELSHEQVAATLQLPLGTAKTRIRSGMRKMRVMLAPLVAALVVGVVGSLIPLGVLHQRDQAARKIDDQAVALLTASDTVAIRLVAAPGESPAAHGTYRGRSGSEIAVIGLSHLPPLVPHRAYRIWIQHGGAWRSLGSVRPDVTGHAHLIARGAALTTLPEAVKVTLETGAESTAPIGPTVVMSTGN
jgi:RNA polymerase sigma-70 factor (ECF subfamily)